jgi:aspartate aminotransferase-like enzyme
MGYSASRPNVLACLAGLEQVPRREGRPVADGAGVEAALARYAALGSTG